MITSINEFRKINEASKKKTDGYDLFLIDIQKGPKYDNDFLKSLNDYCKDFSRVFQIWDGTKAKNPSYNFNNQVKLYKIEQGKELSIFDVPLLFHKPQQEYVINKIKNIPDEYDMFETIYNEYWVYLGFEKWFLVPGEMVKLFDSLKKQNRKVILTGNKETCNMLYHIMFKFGIVVEYNFEFMIGEGLDEVSESLVNESSHAPLYHALKFEYAIQALKNNGK